MDIKTVLVDALEKRYEAQLAESEATIKIYFESSVGIGEHPQHIEEIDKLLTKIIDAESKLNAIKLYR
tara:strand:+ start:1504 stop:1707 length:204 start_codon:yes stop_codon:yes gene_type:complete